MMLTVIPMLGTKMERFLFTWPAGKNLKLFSCEKIFIECVPCASCV